MCVLASSAGPSCYHGDESRHRQSAVISYTLPTEFLLYSPLVYICVLSLHLYSHTFCLCKLYTPFSHVTPDQSLAFSHSPPSELWSLASGVCFNRKLLDQMADVQDGATINMTHQWAAWPLLYYLSLWKINRYYTLHSAIIVSPPQALSSPCLLITSILVFHPLFGATSACTFSNV